MKPLTFKWHEELLLDQGLPRSTTSFLQQSRVTSFHTADLQLSKASDLEILAYAEQRNLTVVTLDSDFHMLLAASGAVSPSVIRLRL
jgi:predicted nuclease of predicted toxin-antitoxin system